jgi:predicted metal-dependent phosphoesterase TrpH
MKIDLHVHTKTGSDGALPVEEVMAEARRRGITLMSVTDHDSVAAQAKALALARDYRIRYVTGIELNVTFQPPQGKAISLDYLGYNFDVNDVALNENLRVMREHREWRAGEIMKRVNVEFDREGIPRLTEDDMQKIYESVDGAFGRPHIAGYLVKKGIVSTVQEAFDRYLVKYDVPKYPLSLADASKLIRDAGGILVLAHPNDPNGTSLVSISRDLALQASAIEQNMLEYIDGVECWHYRHDRAAVAHYVAFAQKHRLITTGGTDCHQKPIVMGSMDIPATVSGQFRP